MKGGEKMARPAMSAKITSKHLTSAEKNAKLEAEERIRGNADRLRPLPHLNKEQKKIFRFIVTELKNSGILSNLDTVVLSDCAVCIERLSEVERTMNENPDKRFDSTLLKARGVYAKDFQRYCNELCLSPQARAKIANIGMQQQEDKSLLLEILGGDDDD